MATRNPAGGHEEGAVANHRQRPVSRDTTRRISCRLGAPGAGSAAAGRPGSICMLLLAGSAAGLRAPGFDDGMQARGLPLWTEGESLVLIGARACLFRLALLRGPLEAVGATARSAARSCRGCADLRPAPAPGKPDPAAAPRPAGAVCLRSLDPADGPAGSRPRLRRLVGGVLFSLRVAGVLVQAHDGAPDDHFHELGVDLFP